MIISRLCSAAINLVGVGVKSVQADEIHIGNSSKRAKGYKKGHKRFLTWRKRKRRK
jgi:hypothetical protein